MSQVAKPIREPTKQMDSDAELPNNLSTMKTRVAYSEPKQDAELPSKITDSTYTQMRGLCHNKNQSQNLLRISQVSMKRSITQLLFPTVPKIYGICQHQSILIPVDYVALPGLIFWADVVKCTLTQQHSWIMTSARQALKLHTCTQQANKVSNLPWCYSQLSVPLDTDCHVWLTLYRKKVTVTSTSTFLNAINSYHRVNTLYNGTINCFSSLAQLSISSNETFSYNQALKQDNF